MLSRLLPVILSFLTTAAFAQLPPTGEFEYPHRLLPDPEESYDPAIPSPDQTLGFDVASRAAFPDEIIAVFEAMADASPKAHFFEYARTYEDRQLVTREALGKGQVILIGFEPNFRGTMAETRQVLFNAMVLGPGFGTEAVVSP